MRRILTSPLFSRLSARETRSLTDVLRSESAGGVLLLIGAAIALICLSGARSGNALRQLRQAGFDNVVHFQGGVSMWRTLGGPLRA